MRKSRPSYLPQADTDPAVGGPFSSSHGIGMEEGDEKRVNLGLKPSLSTYNKLTCRNPQTPLLANGNNNLTHGLAA